MKKRLARTGGSARGVRTASTTPSSPLGSMLSTSAVSERASGGGAGIGRAQHSGARGRALGRIASLRDALQLVDEQRAPVRAAVVRHRLRPPPAVGCGALVGQARLVVALRIARAPGAGVALHPLERERDE